MSISNIRTTFLVPQEFFFKVKDAMVTTDKRLFLGLEIPLEVTEAINEWRAHQLHQVDGRAIPKQNFHITLAFLGQVNQSQFESLLNGCAKIEAPAFDLILNQLGWFTRPQILWLGPDKVPEPLVHLATECQWLARTLDLNFETDYRPHLSLYRKATGIPKIEVPEFSMTLTRFHLYESLQVDGQVQYPILHSWPLVMHEDQRRA